MTTTPSGRMEPTHSPTSALDFNQALLRSRDQARAQWADALAHFQGQMATISTSSLPAVVQAAAPAFALGFSFSAQKLMHEEQAVLRVTLRHRGGAEEFSEAVAPAEGSEAWHALTGSLLAGLLGIPVSQSPRTTEPKHAVAPDGAIGSAAQDYALSPAKQGSGAVDEWVSGESAVPKTLDPGIDPGLEPLTEAEIDTLHKILAAMPQEARKRFTIEFRHHFQVPREVRTIKDRITQRRHKDFIDVFERELAGVKP